MMNVKNIILFSVLFSALVFSVAHVSFAQTYRGALPTGEQEQQQEEQTVPRIFSSQIASEEQARKLDVLYNSLLISLWSYASTDFNYQAKLYSLLSAHKFQYTRYQKEFTPDMQDAMKNLNSNYTSLMDEIEMARTEYVMIKEGIRSIDYEVLDPLWEEKITEFEDTAKQHFKMQNEFLNVYKSLVGYILKQAGKYYYRSSEDRVYFTRFGGYKFYGKSLDKLRKITYTQRQTLKANAPANATVSLP